MDKDTFFLILIPISKEEQYRIVDTSSDEHLYMLYKRRHFLDTYIGMLSSTMREYYPNLANVRHLEEVETCDYFYGGGEEFMKPFLQIKDRPVYKVFYTSSRRVKRVDILNSFGIENFREKEYLGEEIGKRSLQKINIYLKSFDMQ